MQPSPLTTTVEEIGSARWAVHWPVDVKIVDPVSGEPVTPGSRRTGGAGPAEHHLGVAPHRRYRVAGRRGLPLPSGRLSDTINKGGEKFGPVEVEEVLRTHPSVVMSGWLGYPTWNSVNESARSSS